MTDLTAIGKTAAATAKASKELAKLKDATQKVEGLFLKDLLTVMRKGDKHGSIGASYGGGMYDDMMNQAVADAVAKRGGLGFGAAISGQLQRTALQRAMAEMATPHKVDQKN